MAPHGRSFPLSSNFLRCRTPGHQDWGQMVHAPSSSKEHIGERHSAGSPYKPRLPLSRSTGVGLVLLLFTSDWCYLNIQKLEAECARCVQKLFNFFHLLQLNMLPIVSLKILSLDLNMLVSSFLQLLEAVLEVLFLEHLWLHCWDCINVLSWP